MKAMVVSSAGIAPFLESVYTRFHDVRFLGSDPLSVVRTFPEPVDREIAALFAALLAYGNVRQINNDLKKLFAMMGDQPGRFCLDFDTRSARRALGGFKHRFTDAEDVYCLCALLNQVLLSATLEDLFLEGFSPEDEDVVRAAGKFVERLTGLEFPKGISRERMLAKSSFKHLLPRADKGSACKRIHLFLRWVVRNDELDLGLWKRVPRGKLLVPLDTHILRIGRRIGLTKRNTASLLTAREVTAALRQVCCEDPVRFDFSLCRMGILKECPARPMPENCSDCELASICIEVRKR